MCMRTGSRWWSSTRHYFLERHDGNKPSGFLALVNAFGEVSLNQTVPPRVPLGTPIWMQAVEILSAPPPPGTSRFRLSNGLTTTIQ